MSVAHCVLTKLCSPLPEVHQATLFLPLSLCILPLLLIGFCLYSVLHRRPLSIRHILSYRLFLYKATSLYACSSPNNCVTTEHFVMVHVCQHFCRALLLITSTSICRITNKCVYNLCVVFPTPCCHLLARFYRCIFAKLELRISTII